MLPYYSIPPKVLYRPYLYTFLDLSVTLKRFLLMDMVIRLRLFNTKYMGKFHSSYKFGAMAFL